MSPFTTNIQKGAALLDDSRRLVEVWDLDRTAEENLKRVIEGNLLGKSSRVRTADIVLRILRPRFIKPGPQIILALRELLAEPTVFQEACYYETAREEKLLAAFSEEALFPWYAEGRSTIPLEDVKNWLGNLAAGERAPSWSESVRTKVARGLLAALRDFGVIEGATKKYFRTPHLSLKGFSFVAFREHEQGRSSRAIFGSSVWRRWLLDPLRVEDLFVQATRLGVLRFQRVGSSIRIDWLVHNLAEVARAAA